VGVTAAGRPTSPDLVGQVHSALHNVAVAVRGAGGDVSDIARSTSSVVGWTPDMAKELLEGIARARASDAFTSPLPPMTLIGVQALWTTDLLVEIETTAVLD
jgi:enamine deaminase RidA (YjgF/YER057c/UK114 family)